MTGTRRVIIDAVVAACASVALVGAALPGAAAAAAAPTFTVTTNADTAPGAASCATTCSLRAAVEAANATTGATIVVPSGTFALTNGSLVVAKPVTITGARHVPGPDATTIDGVNAVRVLDIASTGVTVDGVVITRGNAGTGEGGGVLVRTGADATLLHTTVSSSTADTGGGISNNGSLTLDRSTVSANSAAKKGGGIWDAGAVTVTNTTIDGNVAAGGGGVASSGTTNLLFTTVSSNTSTNRNGGGLYRVGGTFVVAGSIIAANTTPTKDGHDCYGSPQFAGTNLVENTQGCNPTGSTLVTGDPKLGPLADNSGAVFTRAVAPGSPAVDVSSCGVSVDARDVARPTGTTCDVGAFEYVPLSLGLALRAPSQLPAGAANVPLAKVPRAAIGPVTAGGSAASSTPLGAIDLAKSPLGAIPLSAIPLSAIPLSAIPLSAILLSDVPVTVDGGWAEILKTTSFASVPIETLTLADVLPEIGSLTLSDIDLAATPLSAIPLSAIAFGAAPLGAIPLDGTQAGDTTATILSDWCAQLGSSWCTALGIDPTVPTDSGVTLVSLALAGVPLGAIPLGAIPLSAIPLSAIPLGAIPLGAIPLSAIPLGAIPLSAIPLGAIPLSAIPLSAIPLGAIPLSAINVAGSVDCAKFADGTCTGHTLADAALAGALIGTLATLYDANLGTTPLSAILLRDLYAADPDGPALDGVTLDQLFPGLIDLADLPWEQLDLTSTPLQGLETGGPAPGTFTTTVTVGGTRASVTLDVTLPSGFLYKATTARFDGATVTPTVSGQHLTFDLGNVDVGAHALVFDAWAGLTLGPVTTMVTGTATGAGLTKTASTSGGSAVVEAFEQGDTAGDVTTASVGTLHLAHLSSTGDEDWYRFTVSTPGERVALRLSNLATDFDLTLFGPPIEPLRGPAQQHLLPVADGVLGLDSLGASLPTETLDDLPLHPPALGDVTAYAVSANRGTADEEIDTPALTPGTYYVQVSGYNGASSNQPYSLRMRRLPSFVSTTCASPYTTNTVSPTPGPMPTVPPGTDTLFLVNRSRLEASFGTTDTARIMTAAAAAAGDTTAGVHGVVLPVDADPSVATAYAAWDAHWCSADAANDVVRAIGGVIDAALAQSAGSGDAPTVQHLVLVGADDQVPMARVPDGTAVSNERSYGPTFGFDNPLGASLSSGYLLTDNPYGSSRSIAVGGHELFVPSFNLGRLVEHPDEIVRTLDDFVSAAGVLNPTSALVTGYDFLSDGASQVAANLQAAGVTTPTTLINDAWTSADLANALATPTVASVNAHFDHNRLLPAQGNATGSEADLYTIADLPGDLGRSLLFSMGCHSGLNVPDFMVGATGDWASALAARGAAWAANTGYGYGDTDVVALSETLMAQFAASLGTQTSVGAAMTAAKQAYYLGLASVSPYDEKVLQEVVFYGLPMWRLPHMPTATTSAPQLMSLTSTNTVAFDLTAPGRLHEVVTDHGRYYDVDGQTVTVQNRPILPKVVRDVTKPGEVAHGALVTALTSRDLGAFDPVYFRPTVDSSAHEPERQIGDAPFPAAIQSVRSTGATQSLVVVPGQFRDPVPGTGIGTMRLFTSIGTEVLYADPSVTDFTAPTIQQTTVTATGQITVKTDDTATRVVALWRALGDLGSSTWSLVPLTGGPTTWNASLAVPTGGVELFVQAADENGNVAVSSRKAQNLSIGAPTPTGDVHVALAGSVVGGWYAGSVTVSITGSGTLYYSVDGAPFVPYSTSFTVSSDGTHVIEARDASGSRDAVVLSVDAAPPVTSAVLTPLPAVTSPDWWTGPVNVSVTATDAGSGVASVTLAGVTSPGDSAATTVTAEGTSTVSFFATDQVGNKSGTTSVTVRIDTTSPTVACQQPDGAWHNTNPSFSCTASDAGSGLADPANASFTLTTSVTSYDANASTGTRTVCDRVGHCTVAQVTGVKVDLAPPVPSITAPVGTYLLGASVTASYGCTDVGSDIASCTGAVGNTSIANGGSVPTTSAGLYTFTVTARDQAGNTAVATTTYTVGYGVFLLYDPTKAGNIGSAYPIKLQLLDGTGNNVSSSRIVLLATSVDGGPPPPPNYSGNSNSGNYFRYDSKLRGYIYNLQTDAYAAGSHTMYFTVDGVGGYSAPFTLQ